MKEAGFNSLPALADRGQQGSEQVPKSAPSIMAIPT